MKKILLVLLLICSSVEAAKINPKQIDTSKGFPFECFAAAALGSPSPAGQVKCCSDCLDSVTVCTTGGGSTGILAVSTGSQWNCGKPGGGSGAPTTAQYITRIADPGLSNEYVMGLLSTGLIINTTTTGTPVIYAGTNCTAGQSINTLSATGIATSCITSASSVFGRTGAVVKAEGDYNLSDMGDVTAKKGNSTIVQMQTGSTTTNDCAKFDSNGNIVTASGPCAVAGTAVVAGCTDGSSTNTTAVQAAIDAVTPGGTIEVPSGKICGIGSPAVMKSKLTVRCEGGAGFKLVSGFSGNAMFQTTDGTSLTDVTFDGCTFDLNDAPGGALAGAIRHNGSMTNITIKNSVFNNGRKRCHVWLTNRAPYATFLDTGRNINISDTIFNGDDSDFSDDCGIRVAITDGKTYPIEGDSVVFLNNVQFRNMGGSAFWPGRFFGQTLFPYDQGQYMLTNVHFLGGYESMIKSEGGGITANGMNVKILPVKESNTRSALSIGGTLSWTGGGAHGVQKKNLLEANGSFVNATNLLLAGRAIEQNLDVGANGGGTTYAFFNGADWDNGGAACTTDLDCNGGPGSGYGECVSSVCRHQHYNKTIAFQSGCHAAIQGLTRPITTLSGRCPSTAPDNGASCTIGAACPSGYICKYNTVNWSSALSNAVAANCLTRTFPTATSGTTTSLTDTSRHWDTGGAACTYDYDCNSGKGICNEGLCVPEHRNWQITFGAGCGSAAYQKRMLRGATSSDTVSWGVATATAIVSGCEYDITGGGFVTIRDDNTVCTGNNTPANLGCTAAGIGAGSTKFGTWQGIDWDHAAGSIADTDEFLLHNTGAYQIINNRLNFIHPTIYPALRIVNNTGVANNHYYRIQGNSVEAVSPGYCFEIDAQGAGSTFSRMNFLDNDFGPNPACITVGNWLDEYGITRPGGYDVYSGTVLLNANTTTFVGKGTYALAEDEVELTATQTYRITSWKCQAALAISANNVLSTRFRKNGANIGGTCVFPGGVGVQTCEATGQNIRIIKGDTTNFAALSNTANGAGTVSSMQCQVYIEP